MFGTIFFSILKVTPMKILSITTLERCSRICIEIKLSFDLISIHGNFRHLKQHENYVLPTNYLITIKIGIKLVQIFPKEW